MFTDHERHMLVNGIRCAWEAIAHDALTPGESISQAEVHELALDAHRPVTLGGCDRELYEDFIDNAPADVKRSVLREALPYSEFR